MKKLLFPRLLIKEIKDILTDKNTLMILLIGPIFLTLLFGGVYINSYIEQIPTVVLDEDDSSMSRMIVQQFNESERFELIKKVKTREELKEILDNKTAQMGIYISPNFSQDVSSLKSSEVLILVDGSNMVIGNNAYGSAASIIQTISVGTQMKVISAKGISSSMSDEVAMPFKFNERILYDSKMTYMNYLMMGFIAVFLQQIMLSGIGSILIKKGEEIAYKKTFKQIIIKILGAGAVGLTSIFASIYMASALFNIPIRGDMRVALLMALIFVFAISCPAIILAAFAKNRLKHTQIAFMLSLPTFATCGYVWTIDQLPETFVKIIKVFWPLIYFARPFDEIIVKGLSFNMIKENLIGMAIYILVWMPIAILIFKKRYKIEEKPIGVNNKI